MIPLTRKQYLKRTLGTLVPYGGIQWLIVGNGGEHWYLIVMLGAIVTILIGVYILILFFWWCFE